MRLGVITRCGLENVPGMLCIRCPTEEFWRGTRWVPKQGCRVALVREGFGLLEHRSIQRACLSYGETQYRRTWWHSGPSPRFTTLLPPRLRRTTS